MKSDSNLKEKKMQNTMKVTQENTERGKPHEPGNCPIARPFKHFGGLMRTLLPALLICLLTSVVLMSLSSVAFAQSDAQKSFEKLKTLAGSWEGRVTTVPRQAIMEGDPLPSGAFSGKGVANALT
jgi:hypothetical protein